MSLLRRRGEKRVAELSTLAQILDAVGRGTRAGAGVVSDDRALTLSTFWRCVNLLAENVSGLPVDAYRRTPGRRLELDPQPAFVAAPSAIVSRSTWIYQTMVSLLLRGNSYAVVTAVGADGWPLKAEVVHPDQITVRQADVLSPPEYRFNNSPIDAGRVIHISAYNVPGSVVGLSPVAYAARTLGIGLGADSYSDQLLNGGGHPTAILRSEQALTEEQATRTKERFKKATTDDHLAVLGAGLEYQRVQITPQELSLIESRQVNATDICRFLGVPPELVGAAVSGSSVTYANREQRALDFLVFTLQWWLTRIEEAWTAQLPNKQYLKFNSDALLRPDAKTRTEITVLRLRNGLLNADEGRALDDLPPLPNNQGQLFVWPPTTQGVANGDGSPQPAAGAN